MESPKLGRPSQDKVRVSYSIDRDVYDYIKSLPDGDRSRFVSAALKLAIKKELLVTAPSEN